MNAEHVSQPLDLPLWGVSCLFDNSVSEHAWRILGIDWTSSGSRAGSIVKVSIFKYILYITSEPPFFQLFEMTADIDVGTFPWLPC